MVFHPVFVIIDPDLMDRCPGFLRGKNRNSKPFGAGNYFYQGPVDAAMFVVGKGIGPDDPVSVHNLSINRNDRKITGLNNRKFHSFEFPSVD